MNIRYCPECGGETVDAGLALWADAESSVAVAECQGCGWAGVAFEYWADATLARVASAA